MLHSRTIPVLKPLPVSIFEISTWVNPGGELNLVEDQTPIGWTVVSGTMKVIVNGSSGYLDGAPRNPPEGLNYIIGGTSNTSKVKQDFAVSAAVGLDTAWIDAGEVVLDLDWYGGTFEQGTNDRVAINVTFKDSGGTTISTVGTGLRTPDEVETDFGSYSIYWEHYLDSWAVPANTRTISIELHADRETGSNNDAMFDIVMPQLRRV